MLGVYQIRVTGTKYFYYGSAENCLKRKEGHLRDLRKGGDNLSNNLFLVGIVAKRTKTVRKQIDNMTEAQRKARFGQSGAANGMYGQTHSKDARRKMSLKKKGVKLGPRENWSMSDAQREQLAELGRQRTGEKNGFYGRTHSAETKARISAKKIGSIPSNARKVKIGRKTYPSISEAGRQLNIKSMTLLYRIRSKHFPDYSYKD